MHSRSVTDSECETGPSALRAWAFSLSEMIVVSKDLQCCYSATMLLSFTHMTPAVAALLGETQAPCFRDEEADLRHLRALHDMSETGFKPRTRSFFMSHTLPLVKDTK